MNYKCKYFFSALVSLVLLISSNLFQAKPIFAKTKTSEVWGSKDLCAYLGGKEKNFHHDIDVYTFTGQKGEKVVLNLKANPFGSFTGEEATLILTSKFKHFFKIDRGSLPHKISAILPAKGEYYVYVIEGLKHKSIKSFKGDYCLTLKSSKEAWKSLQPFHPSDWRRHPIAWIPEKMEETVSKRTSTQLKVAFISKNDLKKVNLWITPELRPFLRLEPNYFENIEAHTTYEVILHLVIPEKTKPGLYDGTIHLRGGHRTYPDTLKLSLNIIENILPVADAGPDQSLLLGIGQNLIDVQLDATRSFDPDGTIENYLWNGVPDPEDIAKPTIQLPAGTHIFNLVVKDNKGGLSTPDSVTITVSPNPDPDRRMSFAEENFIYYSGGKQINLEIFPQKISMRVASGQMEHLRQWLTTEPLIEQPLEIEEIGRKNIILVTLAEGISLDQIFSLISKLNQTGFVVYASPIFGQENEKILLTDQFVVKFKDAYSIEQIENFIAAKNVAIIKKNFIWRKCYLLAFTPASGLNSIQVSREFYESGMAEYAHPDFIVMASPPWITLMHEDFERDFPKSGWQIYDANPADGLYFWGKVSNQTYPSKIDEFTGGNSKLWVAANHDPSSPDLHPNDEGLETYAPNMDSWMIFGPFDFSQAYWMKLEYLEEYEHGDEFIDGYHESPSARLLVSPNGVDWYHPREMETCEFSLSWTSLYSSVYQYVNLVQITPLDCDQDLLKKIWFALRFQSDGDIKGDPHREGEKLTGVYIDDIKILGSNTEPAPLLTNDPFSSLQWNLKNVGQSGGEAGWDINLLPAWDFLKNTVDINPTDFNQKEVIVAVLDEGVDLDHEDLNLVPGYDATYDPSDPESVNTYGGPNNWDGHGTACAGIIGAKNNDRGIVGVTPGVRIMPVRIAFSKQKGASWTFSPSQAAEGILWAVNNGAKILSNSWGGGPENDLLHDAIREAKSRGAVIIFAAGNYGHSHVIFPARYEETIAVGAMSPCGEKKKGDVWGRENFSCDREFWSSNYGPELDVLAPGVMIPTTDITGTGGYGQGNYINFFNGTSSAAPHVAGVAALMLALNPQLDPETIREILRITAKDLGVPGRDDETGYGLVDAEAAVKKASGWNKDLTITSFSTSGEVYPSSYLSTTVVIANQGLDQAGTFDVGFYLSVDNQLSDDDIFLGYHKVDNVAALGEREISGTIQVPGNINPGYYFLIAYANYNKMVQERNLENNLRLQLLNVINPPNLIVKPAAIDFGSVLVGTGMDKSLQIKNEVPGASGSLKITGISYSGDDIFQLDIPNYPTSSNPWLLENHQSIFLPVYFIPQSAGSFSGTITIISNDPDEGEKRIQLTGTAIEAAAQINIQPGLLLFSDSNLGQSLIIENTGNTALTWTIGYDWYQNIPWPSWLTIIPLSGQTGPGASSTVNVSVNKAGLSAGTYVYNIYIQSNDPYKPNLPILIVFTVAQAEALMVRPNSINLGYNTLSSFSITNNSQNCVSSLQWQIGANLPSWLSVTPMNGEIDTCGGVSQVIIQINRTGLLPGEYSHTLWVNSNSGSGNVEVRMSAPPPIFISPGSSQLNLCGDKKIFTASGGLPPYRFDLVGLNGETVPDFVHLTDNGDGTASVQVAPCNLTRDTSASATEPYVTMLATDITNYLMPISLYRRILSDSEVYLSDVQQVVNTECGAAAVTLKVTDSLGSEALASISFEGENNWSKTYGPWQANYIEETSAGAFIMGGVISQIGYPYVTDIRLTKLSQTGQIQWDRQVSMLGSQGIGKIQETSDGGYIVLGASTGWGPLIIKLDNNGNIVWKEIINGAIVYGPMDQTTGWTSLSTIKETPDGGFILAGTMDIYLRNENRIQTGMMAVKLNSDGSGQWWKFYHQGLNSKSGILDIQLISNGGFIGIGWVVEDMYSSSEALPMLVKFDSNGNILWNKRYESSGYISMGFDSLALTSDGGYIIAGLGTVSSSGEGEGSGGSPLPGGIPIDGEGDLPLPEGNGGETPYIPRTDHLIIIKTSSDGTIDWQKEYQNVSATMVAGINPTNDGGYIIGLNDTSANQDAWIVKINDRGEIVWQKAYGTDAHYDALFSLQKTSEGGYIAAGGTYSFSSSEFGQAWILKIGPDGNCHGCGP